MPLYAVPTQNALQKTLDANALTGATTITLNNTTGVQNLPGIAVIDRVDSNNTATPSKREYISFTGTSGANLTGVTRGLAGSTDQDHSVGAIVEFIPDVVWAQAVYDSLANLVSTSTLAVDTTKVVTPSGTQTLTNKTLTSPVLNTGVSGTAIDTDTTLAADSDTKLASQKAVKAYVDARSGTRPTFRAHKNGTNQSVSSGVDTKLTFGTESFDTASNYDISTSRFTPTTAGKYLVNVVSHINATSDQTVLTAYIYKNGSNVAQQRIITSSASKQGVQVSSVIDMNGSTDYVEAYIHQSSGSAQDISGAATDTYFEGMRVD